MNKKSETNNLGDFKMKTITKMTLKFSLVFSITVPAYLFSQGQTLDSGISPPTFERVGQAGWQFLKLPGNARFAATGGIVSSLAGGDASYSFGNPASVNDADNISVSANMITWFADINYQTVAVTKTSGRYTYGFHLISLNYGDMLRTENQPILSDGINTGQVNVVTSGLGNFTANDLAIGGTFAMKVTDRLQFGLNVRSLSQKIDDMSVSGISLDVGTVYYTAFAYNLRICAVGRNFGPNTQYEDNVGWVPSSIRMPINFTFGAAADIIGADGGPNILTVATEFIHPNDGPEKLNFGAEYGFNKMLYLRGGYRSGYDEEGLTFGGGLSFSLSNMTVNVDFAYLDYGRLGNTSVMSFGIGF